MQPIDANCLPNLLHQFRTYDDGSSNRKRMSLDEKIMRMADCSIPTIEPVKHGKWIHTGYFARKCSYCDEIFYELEADNYCPHCGAKMDGGDENETD